MGSSEVLTRTDCPSPPAVAHSLNEATQEKTSQPVLFLDSSRRHTKVSRHASGIAGKDFFFPASWRGKKPS